MIYFAVARTSKDRKQFGHSTSLKLTKHSRTEAQFSRFCGILRPLQHVVRSHVANHCICMKIGDGIPFDVANIYFELTSPSGA